MSLDPKELQDLLDELKASRASRKTAWDNLQELRSILNEHGALCFSCNAMKRDRDDTDFRAVRREYDRAEIVCPFCSIPASDVLIENTLSVAIRDKYPVTDWHILVVPKRHAADYFDLGAAESRACHRLIAEARSIVSKADPSVMGFNIGINSGLVAGQPVMHCHVHLIPRRVGDHPNPQGGVRGVIPGKADYP